MPAERLHGLDQQMEKKEDESLYFMDRIWVPLMGGPGVSTAQRLQRKYAKCLLLLVHNCLAEVNVASENMLEVTTASEYQVNVANMDQDSAHMVAASKVPMLKPGKFEIWRMRIEQYIQMIDYALWEVIENGATLPKTTTVEATRKTQRNLLKQQYENFTTPSSEMLDQSFDGLQNLVSELELLDEKLSQEDVNQNLLRSLSPKWNTHAVMWRNKADLDTMSLDDLYNNLKVYEPEV
ncbi:hypothetical protein Tco_1087974 [Tanacetum coccineum]